MEKCEKLFITPNDTVREDDSASIQAAVDLARERGLNYVVIPRINARTGDARWVISRTVKLPSGMLVELWGCFMQMADGVVGGFFASDNLFTERALDLKERMYGIHIRGVGAVTLDGGRPTELNEETQVSLGTPVRQNSPIFFINVERFSVENLRIAHQRYWGMRFEFCSRGEIRNIHFDVCRDRRNQDGINLRNGCHDILIENISGQTGDDMIALSALDHDKSLPFGPKYDVIVKGHDWDIHDVTIRNISGFAITHPLVALRNHNGAKIYNIHIENVRDTLGTRPAHEGERPRYALIHLGDWIYYAISQMKMGDLYNITVRDLYVNYSTAAVQVGGAVNNLRVSGVFASGACRDILSVFGDNWGDDVYGAKIENMQIDSVIFDAKVGESSVLNFAFMREGDYVKNLTVRNSTLIGVDRFATVHTKAECFEASHSGVSFIDSSDRTVSTSQPIRIKRAERNLPPFKSTVERDDLDVLG